MKHNIRFDTNKNGKKVAFIMTNDRNIRMNLEEAELLVSTGNVSSVTYGPNPFSYGVSYIGTEEVNGVHTCYTAYNLNA